MPNAGLALFRKPETGGRHCVNYSNLESESFRCILIKILVMFTASPGYPALPPSPPLRSSPPSLSPLSSHTPIHLIQTPDSLPPTHPPASLPAQSHPSVVPPCTAGILRSNFSDRATEGSEYLVYALTGIRLELFGVRAVRQTKVEQRQTMLCCAAIRLSLSLLRLGRKAWPNFPGGTSLAAAFVLFL